MLYRLEQGSANYLVCFCCIIGHMQQGGSPTPFDRNLGTKMASKAVDWLVDVLKKNTVDGKINCTQPDTACLLGVVKRQYKFTPLSELKEQTNFEYVFLVYSIKIKY